MGKVPVVNRDDYTMFLEFHDNLLWFHTDVRKWTSSVKTKFLEDLNLLQYLVSVPLIALVEENNTKLSKFGDVTGFVCQQKILGNDNKMYYIYSRSL